MTWPKFGSCTLLMQLNSIATVYTYLLRFFINKAWSLKVLFQTRSLLRKISEVKYKKTFQHTCFTRRVLSWQLVDRLIINSEYRGTIHCVRADLTFTHDICTLLRYQALYFSMETERKRRNFSWKWTAVISVTFSIFSHLSSIQFLAPLFLNKGSCPCIQTSVTALH